MESQNININNIKNIKCNTFSENELNVNDSIIFEKDISTSVDESSFLNKFNIFLTNNNISIENNFIPMAVNDNGQKFLKQNAFWDKYINYIYINYTINNIRLSLFSFVHIIEQYFLWCENLSTETVLEFKKSIIDIINKIYDNDDINQFCSMNRINNLEDLFEKYKIFMSINKDGNTKSYKEIELKIDNKSQDECNCELCKSEAACMKKLIEVNKNKIIGVNIENLFYDSNKNNENKIEHEGEDEDENEEYEIKKKKKTYPPRKSPTSLSSKKNEKNKFSNTKIKKSSGQKYQYMAKEEKEREKEL